MDDMKRRIDDVIISGDLESSTLEDLFNNIRDLENEEERIKLFSYFIEQVREAFKNYSYESVEELQEDINEIRENLRTYGGLSDEEIDVYFTQNNFNVEEISKKEKKEELEEEKEEKREIVKINERISELEQELGLNDGKTIEEIEEEIRKNIGVIEGKTVKELEQKIEELDKKLQEISKNDINNIVEYNKVVNEKKKVKEELEERKKQGPFADKTNEDLIEDLEKIKQEIEDRKPKTIEELEAEIKEINEQIEAINNDPKGHRIDIYTELREKRTKLEEEIEKIKNQPEQAPDEITEKLKAELEAIEKEIEKRSKNNPYVFISTEELEKELKELNEKKDKILEENGEELKGIDKTKYDSIVEKIIEIEKELNRRKMISNYEELKGLTQIRDAYAKIQEEAINKFEEEKELSEEELDEAVNEFVNNHELISELDKYEDAEKLKQQLKEDIKNNLKTKKIDKKEQNKKLLLKGLAAVGGFVTGLGLSCVPGVGTIRMGIAATKLAVSGINFWSQKHPEGKIAKLRNATMEKINKIPGAPKIIEQVNKMRAKLKSTPWNCFINGVSAGYITGNLIELFTGETILEHLQGDSKEIQIDNPIKETGDTGNNIPNDNVPTDEIISESIQTIDPSEIMLNQGEVVDISSILQGSTSPGGELVNIMEEVGKEVQFDKIAQAADGKIYWHFKQMNGAGYAWIEASKVQEVLAKAASVGSKTL